MVAFGGKGATGTVDVKDVGARLHMEAALVRRKQEEMSAVARFREGEEEMVGCTWTPELSVGTVMQTSERVTMSDNIFDHLYMKSVQDEDKFKYYESIAGVSEEVSRSDVPAQRRSSSSPSQPILLHHVGALLTRVCAFAGHGETDHQQEERGDC